MPTKLASKATILKKIKQKNFDYFYNGEFLKRAPEEEFDYGTVEYEDYQKRKGNGSLTPVELENEKLETLSNPIEDWNMGDGNASFRTYYFPQYDLYVSLTGYYSSYGGDEWEEIFVSEPYEYKETRYRQKTVEVKA